MLVVISPAKTLDYETPPKTKQYSVPGFLDQTQQLVNLLRSYSARDLAELMHISGRLAELNFERFRRWSTPFTPRNAKAAVLAMKGDVYTGLDAESFNDADFAFAQDHLRILSGLYGVLRPLDLMQAYRLEMGSKLPNPAGRDLYAFWGETITAALNRELQTREPAILINLASNEYFKSVKPRLVHGRVITPQFKERKDGKYRIIGVFAKKARGLMSRYIIRNRIADPEALKQFDLEGYCFDPSLSKDAEWVFARG